MKSLVILVACFGIALATPAQAQSNNDDYTPLNSRIKRDRQFPADLPNRWRNETSAVSRTRSREMMSQFSACLYNRSHEGSLDLLQKTDFGFADFAQIGLDTDRAVRIYGFRDCLGRVADSKGMGVQLRFSAGGLRQLVLQEAYFDRFGDAPTWIQPGHVIDAREYPLSGGKPEVRSVMDFGDCVVAADPYTADFFYRTTPRSAEEKRAIEGLTPALGPCLPEGQQVQLSTAMLRVWLGEALWHAATHSRLAPAAAPEEVQ